MGWKLSPERLGRLLSRRMGLAILHELVKEHLHIGPFCNWAHHCQTAQRSYTKRTRKQPPRPRTHAYTEAWLLSSLAEKVSVDLYLFLIQSGRRLLTQPPRRPSPILVREGCKLSAGPPAEAARSSPEEEALDLICGHASQLEVVNEPKRTNPALCG